MYKYIFIFLFIFPLFTMTAQKKSKNQVSVVNVPKPEVKLPHYDEQLKALKWRSIGPFRGGRSVTACGVPGDIHTYYMGTTGGGIWKTEDMGLTWKNVSDGFVKTGSVGALAVAPSDVNVVYAGMGEHAPRGVMTHHGDGVYKSTDAGKTWKHTGLEKTQHIARVLVHPANPDIAFVAAQGALYGPSEERGIYKTTDGGKNWKKVLFVNQKTGCSELSMDANNHRILYATMWEHGREPWKVTSGGPGSGVYKSVDGGETWNKIQNGLPDELGKMAIAVAPSNSNKVYVLIESDREKSQAGLYVSDNGGDSWSKVTTDQRLVQRSWYYMELFIDPKNENTIYVLSAPALKSIDGGKTWDYLDGPHGDYHDLWINPQNPKNMIIADDGGASVTFNGGMSWSPQNNMPTAQLYRINVDNDFPYNIYAGQQDNTSLKIASMALGSGGITESHWSPSAGGESAFLAFDPDDPRYVLGGSYLGTISVLDTKTKSSTSIMPAPIQYLAMEPNKMKYRYNWNAPIIWSKHEKNTFYHAAQVLIKTTDMGKTWKEVSPDLTRNLKEKQGKGGGPYTNEIVGAENYGTISYVTESPHEKGVIWTGSDDGWVHITRDNGASWSNITPADLTECLINAIEVSPHDKATAYIATTRYKFNDHSPGLYKTTDYGKTWENISTGIPQGSFTRVVREDNKVKDLLFAGTETGVFISVNGGRSWSPFQLNLPLTPVTDLKIHRSNLIAATSGRSFWILDDLHFLRQYIQNTDSTLKLFEPAPVVLVNARSDMNGNIDDFKGSHPFRGVNPATGAVIYYNLPPDVKGDVTLEITDMANKLVRKVTSGKDVNFISYDGGPPSPKTLPKKSGLNRFVWDLRHETMPGVPFAYIESDFRGHLVIPGEYTIKITTGDTSLTTLLKVEPVPGVEISKSAYDEYDDFMSETEMKVTEMHTMINHVQKKMSRIDELLHDRDTVKMSKPVLEELKKLKSDLKSWDEDMVQRRSKAYDDVENFENKFTAEYLFLINHNDNTIPMVNQPSKDQKKVLDDRWKVLKARGEKLLGPDIKQMNEKLWVLQIGGI
jgi:photosystem II stability/assembly factor-like uncharacterized protein